MSLYEKYPKLPGATLAEKKALKIFKRIDIMRATGLSRYFVERFMAGQMVPDFVRKKLTHFLYEKSQELRNGTKNLLER